MYHGGTFLLEEGLEYISSLAEWKGTGDFNLDNISKVLDFLGNPQDSVPMVHVTGTNGKGSTSVAIASILGASGYSVGLTISPHLQHINERIILNGQNISNELLSYLALSLKEACKKVQTQLSFHEAMTVLAFLAFQEIKVDFGVLEVGLGGRLDSTNVIKSPKVAVITTVDLDHTHILGNSREEIAREKSFIIKPGCVVIVGDLSEEALKPVVNRSKECGVSLLRYNQDFFGRESNGEISFSCPEGNLLCHPTLQGPHQIANMSLAMQAAIKLSAPLEACKVGVEQVFWPARVESINKDGTKILLDCAHNPAGVAALVSYLKRENLQKIPIVFGALESKNWQEMTIALIPYVEDWNLLSPDSTRALPNDTLKCFLEEKGCQVKDFEEDYRGTRDRILKYSGFVLVTGSMYMVGKLRSFLIEEEPIYWRRRANTVL